MRCCSFVSVYKGQYVTPRGAAWCVCINVSAYVIALLKMLQPFDVAAALDGFLSRFILGGAGRGGADGGWWLMAVLTPYTSDLTNEGT